MLLLSAVAQASPQLTRRWDAVQTQFEKIPSEGKIAGFFQSVVHTPTRVAGDVRPEERDPTFDAQWNEAQFTTRVVRQAISESRKACNQLLRQSSGRDLRRVDGFDALAFWHGVGASIVVGLKRDAARQ